MCIFCLFLMIRRPTSSTRTDTLFPYTTRFRSGSRYRLPVGLLTGGIVAVLVGNMIGQIELNQWHGAFFDALESQNIGAFGNQLLIFLAIVAGLLAMVVGQTWIQEMLKVRQIGRAHV